jgi:uncharacterized protein YjbI with pentapeptide repeats
LSAGLRSLPGGSLIAFALIVPQAGDDPAARLEAIRTAWTVTAGLAGLVTIALFVCNAWYQKQALYLQHKTHELQQRALQLQREVHQLQVEKNQQDRADALERQVTEELDKAIEQISTDKPASQINGLHKLDRLGRDHPDLREQVAAHWCSLLRIPASVDLPGQQEVRALAQRLLLGHLHDPYDGDLSARPGAAKAPDYWELSRIDLRGAVLVDADFTDGLLPPGFDARSATFHGHTSFANARFRGAVAFTKARFDGSVDFSNAFFAKECDVDFMSIAGTADFTKVDFRGPLECQSAMFHGPVMFNGAQFGAPARFWKSTFTTTADFFGACWHFEVGFTLVSFEDFANFRQTRFIHRAVFGRATFCGPVTFESAQFGSWATFTGVTFCDAATFARAYFDQDVAFDDAQFGDIVRFREARFEAQVTCCGARFDDLMSFTGALFKDRADFSLIHLGTGARVDFTDAVAARGVFVPSDRIWPRGWTTLDNVIDLRLVPIPEPSNELSGPIGQPPDSEAA